MTVVVDPRAGLRSIRANQANGFLRPRRPHARPRRRDAAAVLAVAALGALPLACGGGDAPALITATGHVEATDVRIAAKVGGTLVSLPLREGDIVSAGQELARIDTVDLVLERNAAAAERDRAEADLRLLRAGSREEDVREAEAQEARAVAERDAAERDLVRQQALLDAGPGTPEARDDALARRDMAAAGLEAARQRLARLRRGSRPEEIEAARARRDAAAARVDAIDQQIRDATVRSPAAGVITEKIADQGEVVAPLAPLLVITDLQDAWLNVYVAEPDLDRLRLGQEAEVVTDGGAVRRGRVGFISPLAEFTPKNVQTRDERVKLVYRVKILLDNADGLFKPGMPAEARLRPVLPEGGP
jgi:HlyD family secretion protein